MPDVQRTLAALLAILADNPSGDISEQDNRDLLVSIQGSHGTIGVQGNAVETVISDTVSYFEMAPVTTLGEALRFDQSANGRLRYTGAPTVAVAVFAVVTLLGVSPNQDVFVRIGKNGAADAESEQRIRKLDATENIVMALQLLDQASLNDYYSLLVRNTSSSSNVVAVNVSLMAMTRMV